MLALIGVDSCRGDCGLWLMPKVLGLAPVGLDDWTLKVKALGGG